MLKEVTKSNGLSRNLRVEFSGCGFGSRGLCCFACAEGPCRANPYAAGHVLEMPCRLARDPALMSLGAYLVTMMTAVAALLNAGRAGPEEIPHAQDVPAGVARAFFKTSQALARARESAEKDTVDEAVGASVELASLGVTCVLPVAQGGCRLVFRVLREYGDDPGVIRRVVKEVALNLEGVKTGEISVPGVLVPALAVGLAANGSWVICHGWRPGGWGPPGEVLADVVAREVASFGGNIEFLAEPDHD